jgi:hypothetical protein
MNEEEPQLQQTRSLGNTKTPTVSALLRPEKRMFTSAGNSIWLLEAQDVHTNGDPSKIRRYIDKTARRGANAHQYFG